MDAPRATCSTWYHSRAPSPACLARRRLGADGHGAHADRHGRRDVGQQGGLLADLLVALGRGQPGRQRREEGRRGRRRDGHDERPRGRARRRRRAARPRPPPASPGRPCRRRPPRRRSRSRTRRGAAGAGRRARPRRSACTCPLKPTTASVGGSGGVADRTWSAARGREAPISARPAAPRAAVVLTGAAVERERYGGTSAVPGRPSRSSIHARLATPCPSSRRLFGGGAAPMTPAAFVAERDASAPLLDVRTPGRVRHGPPPRGRQRGRARAATSPRASSAWGCPPRARSTSTAPRACARARPRRRLRTMGHAGAVNVGGFGALRAAGGDVGGQARRLGVRLSGRSRPPAPDDRPAPPRLARRPRRPRRPARARRPRAAAGPLDDLPVRVARRGRGQPRRDDDRGRADGRGRGRLQPPPRADRRPLRGRAGRARRHRGVRRLRLGHGRHHGRRARHGDAADGLGWQAPRRRRAPDLRHDRQAALVRRARHDGDLDRRGRRRRRPPPRHGPRLHRDARQPDARPASTSPPS